MAQQTAMSQQMGFNQITQFLRSPEVIRVDVDTPRQWRETFTTCSASRDFTSRINQVLKNLTPEKEISQYQIEK